MNLTAKISRRALLGGLLAVPPAMLLACSSDQGAVANSGGTPAPPDDTTVATTVGRLSSATLVLSYGNGTHRFGHLDVPTGPAPSAGWPVVVLIHGGFWRTGYDVDLMFDLARSLNDDGWATWNIQYASSGDRGGGWPGTFDDVAAAIDHLAAIDDAALDTSRVVTVGHSAGGHLALWAASRRGFAPGEPGADPIVDVRGVVSLAGITDLLRCDAENLGSGACRELMGVAPRDDLRRFLLASPIERLPTGVPTVLVHGDRDLIVPVDQSQRFAFRAIERGDSPTLLVIGRADHFAPISADHEAWQKVRPLFDELAPSDTG